MNTNVPISLESPALFGTVSETEGLPLPEKPTLIEQADARTEQAEALTEQANTRTEQAEARSEQAIRASELRYRRLFETAQDGILILDADTGQVVDANPFMKDLLGYSQEEFLGRKLWEIGPFKGEAASKIAFAELQHQDRLHYEGLPLETKEGKRVEVEFISNAYLVDQKRLIQCNIRDITERQEVASQLLWKTAFFEAQVHSSMDGILVVDRDGQMILQNQRMADLWNIPAQIAEETDDRRRLEWVTNQVKNPSQFAEKIAYLSEHTDEITHDELELKNGKFFDRYSAPVRNKTGQDFGRIWAFRDITERKKSEARFHRLVDSNAQGVIFWNRNGGITEANEAFLRMVGYTHEDLDSGRVNWVTLTPPEYAHLDQRALEQIAFSGVSAPYEKELLCKDGSRMPVLLGAAAFEDSPDEGVCFFVDITERKRFEEQIIEQAALLDKAQDAILVRDLEGKVLFWNKGAERMYGWAREEVAGKNVIQLDCTDLKRFAEVNGLTISQGEWHGELQHVTRDKREITIEARWTLIRDNDGQPKSILAINTDVTARKKIEAQFMRAQRMESIGTLAGGIAHDLNNILAPIMMSIGILKTMSEDPQALKILDTIEISATRGASIVRQVLSFARGVEGQRIEVQPGHLLSDLENIIKETFPKDIHLQFSIPQDTWTLLGDPTQLHQILLNLAVNARDAMPNGGNLVITVENSLLDEHYVGIDLQTKAGRYVQISVTDSGTGIPADILDKIFEPFFTTKELNKGTGLGLSSVMAIVKSHGGMINVYSEPRKGTTFKMYLPAMDVCSEKGKESAEPASPPRGRGETILIVDDEPSILTITSQTLQAFGYRILTATDGAEAVALYAKNEGQIAAVLTDMMMPVMDGAAVIRVLTRINPAVKIIATSGLNANGSTVKLSGGVVKHFLTKPYTAGTLLKAMRSLLDEA